MASTYSNLKIQLMATGENSGTWGNVTNVNLGTAIEQAMVETATVTFSSANVTLTLTDTNAAQNARALRLNLTGTTGGARDLIVPAVQKPYIVNNGTADTITVKVSGQTGIAVPASKTMLVYNNGTDVVDAINHLSALSLTTALPISSGGTGSTTATFSGENITSLNASNISSGTLGVAQGGTGAGTLTSEAVVIGNTTGAVKFVSPGTDGNVLTSNGTAWVSEAPVVPQGVPTGSVMAFAGDPGAGWLECNGQIVSQSTYSDLYSKVGLLADAFQTTSYQLAVAGSTDVYPALYCGAYGNSTYVVGGEGDVAVNNNSIYTSTDAITWTARSVGWVSGMLYPRAMIYTDKFISGWVTSGTADTNGNRVATSTDGITWTVRTVPPATFSGSITSLAYNGSNTVVITSGSFGEIATSTDGITWTKRTPAINGLSSYTQVVAYGNSTFVLAQSAYQPGRTFVSTSTDGITWTFRSNAWNFPIAIDIRYLNNKFWMHGFASSFSTSPCIWTSTDGITWAQNTTLPRYLHLNRLTYDSTNSLLVAHGYKTTAYSNYSQHDGSSTIAVSGDDGVTWQLCELGADIFATSTSVQAPASTTGGVIVGTNGMSAFNYLNNRLVIGGYYNVFWNNPTRTGAAVKTITNPYTYQTDTQFALPAARIMGAANGNPGVAGLKSSNAAGALTGNYKYYIKT